MFDHILAQNHEMRAVARYERVTCPDPPEGCGGSGMVLIPRPVNSTSVIPDYDEQPCPVCHETGEVDADELEDSE